MRVADLLRFNSQVLLRHRWRTVMLLVAMAIGVLAVNLLTGLGEGARGYVLGEFKALGQNTLIMMPGRKETTGGMPPIMGTAPRNITLNDAEAITRVPGVARIAPLVIGSIDISRGSLSRDTVVLGTNATFFDIRQLDVRQGHRLPDIANDRALSVCLIGETIRKALFGNRSALGAEIRLGQTRFRVIGLLGDKGQAMGMNFDEAVIVPVASAQQLFNQEGLFRIFIEVAAKASIPIAQQRILTRMAELHQGDRDVTVITQDAIMASFNKVLTTMTLAVAGIGAISLLVAGVLIMNVTMISVSQRTAEIGLLKALGAASHDVRTLFLAESGSMAALGAVIGLGLSELILAGARLQFPDIPFYTPWWAGPSSVAIASGTALLFAWLPSRRASRMAPVTALQSGRGT